MGTNCSSSRKRDITLFEENASCVRKRINLDSRGTTTLYSWDFQILGKWHRGSRKQGAGLGTHTCVVDLFAEEDPGGTAAHEGPTREWGAVGGMDQQNKTFCELAQPHGSPVTSLKGQGGTESDMPGSGDQERWRRTVGLKTHMGKGEERHFPHVLFYWSTPNFSPQ